MSDQQIRDEVLTLLIASHETNANALAWTWHLLARNPEAEGKLFAEVDALQETPTASDLAKLSYTSAVVNESMRLYPPAWTIVREVVRDWDIAGSRIRPGMQVAMSPWVVQRDRRFFPDPLRFRPERWLDGSMDALPTYAYFPFGGGQRLCIGRPFALLEGSVVLATVARHWRLRAVSDREVVPLPSITLRPRGGLPMRVERR
jgi:cytochrome P450